MAANLKAARIVPSSPIGEIILMTEPGGHLRGESSKVRVNYQKGLPIEPHLLVEYREKPLQWNVMQKLNCIGGGSDR